MTRSHGTAAVVLGLLLSACSMAGSGPARHEPTPERPLAGPIGEPAPEADDPVEGSAALEEAGLSGVAVLEDGFADGGWTDADWVRGSGPGLEAPAPTPGEFLYHDGALPVAARRQVDEFVHAMTEGRAAEGYKVWLEREAVWGDWVRGELRAAGLPEDLVYLAMIESGFSPTIVSHAGATGMWQFMRGTARAAGLRVDGWIDERRDPEAATRAAIRHLAELYEATGDWALAAAAYNAGLGRVTRAQAREPEGRRDYFSLSAARRLPRETRNYVPIMLAAAWIDAHRSRYGLPPRVAGAPPVTDSLAVDGRVRLSVLAEGLGVPFDTLKALNGRLARGAIPPEGGMVRVPVGTDTTGLLGFLAAVPPEQRLLPDWLETHYVVRSGDSYWRIARRYDTTVDRLRRLNPRRGDVIHPGDRLVVRRVASYDIPGRVEVVTTAGTATSATDGGTATTARTATNSETATDATDATDSGTVAGTSYVVRAGDTMTGIARRLGVGLDDLARWNDMASPRPLRAGETIQVGPPVLRYTVRPGDTMSGLAQRFGVALAQLAEWNAMERPRPLQVGETLVVRRR